MHPVVSRHATTGEVLLQLGVIGRQLVAGRAERRRHRRAAGAPGIWRCWPCAVRVRA